MKIATNTPFSFDPRPNIEIAQLGAEPFDASCIILLLEKNWGSGSIDKIQSLTHWLHKYPEGTPCFIIGAEATMNDRDFRKYAHSERDSAVLTLCKAVLERSKSIGVRGSITYHYLTDWLGIDNSSVNIIYDKNDNNNITSIGDFSAKNGAEYLIKFRQDISRFQANPVTWYERPSAFKSEININRPIVEKNGDSARLSADISIDGNPINLWLDTGIVYKQFLLHERSDAFLCATLPLAMRTGRDIVCDAPVTEQFYHNLTQILIPQLCSHDKRLHPTAIKADLASSSLPSGNAVATGMSCGVDSLYTAKLYSGSRFAGMNLTHLYTGNYLYGNDSKVYDRAEAVADLIGLPLIKTSTNLNQALRIPHVATHFFKTIFGIMALRKLFRIYYYSSASDFSNFNLSANGTNDTSIYELLLLYSFSCNDIQIVTGGVKSGRLDKTRALSGYEPARKFLNVCLYPDLDRNCGKCAKCRRTLLSLDMIGSLDEFDNVFDIEAYKNSRIESFAYLSSQKNSIMLASVYKYFKKNEPELMRAAESGSAKA